MPTDETPDNGATAFVMPTHPQDVVVRLAIKAEEIQGEGLLLSASMTPGNQTWEHQAVEEVFRQARTAPQLGTYVFETSAGGTRFVSGPEEVSRPEARDMVFFLAPAMHERREQLVAALEAFPTSEVITQAARRIVNEITGGSLERSPLDVIPVVDARTVKVVGVDCIDCGFGIEAILGLAFSAIFGQKAIIDDGTTQVGNLKFAIREQDGQPVVQVGYLRHSSDFAAFLNNALAERVREAVQAVAVEVAIEGLVRIERQRRRLERLDDAIRPTYGVDLATIAQRADALEAEARARFAPPPEADGDGTDEVDDLGDEDTGDGHDDASAEGDELLDEAPAGDPTEEEPAPPPAG